MRRPPIRSAASRLSLAKNPQVTQLVGQRPVIRTMSYQGAGLQALGSTTIDMIANKANKKVREDMS
jgi:hypothetical protein